MENTHHTEQGTQEVVNSTKKKARKTATNTNPSQYHVIVWQPDTNDTFTVSASSKYELRKAVAEKTKETDKILPYCFRGKLIPFTEQKNISFS